MNNTMNGHFSLAQKNFLEIQTGKFIDVKSVFEVFFGLSFFSFSKERKYDDDHKKYLRFSRMCSDLILIKKAKGKIYIYG